MKNSIAKKRKQVPAGYLVVGVDPHKKKQCNAKYIRADSLEATV
jgi:hypothetical protein